MIWSPRELGGKAWTPQLKLVLARGDDGVTRIERRRSRYPYVVLRPFWFGDRPDGMATVILQSGSGGLYAGEQLGQHFVVGPDAAAQVTTQAATVVHSSEDMGTTQVRTMVDLGLGAHFEYIADPLILFPGASLQQVVDARLRPDSIFVLAEGTLRHDPGPGDRPFAHLASRVTIRGQDGEVLARDSTSIAGEGFDGSLSCAAGRWSGTGLVLAAAPGRVSEHDIWSSALNETLASLGPVWTSRVYAACALLPNAAGIACRIVAQDGQALRAALDASWRCLRQVITGTAAPRPRK